jgi:outer membrane protein OmpA-like peptidoglycan-associated protein
MALKKDAVLTLRNVFFETGSARLNDDSRPELDKVAKMLHANPKAKIELGGHTDNVGGAEANLRLSAARAEAVKAYLMQKGVDPERMTTKGYGDTQPVAPNDTDEGRAANRRTELKILDAGK